MDIIFLARIWIDSMMFIYVISLLLLVDLYASPEVSLDYS